MLLTITQQPIPNQKRGLILNNLIGKLSALLVMGIDVITVLVLLMKNGQLKALAVTSAKHSLLLPDVPATAEAGYPKLRIDNY